MRRPVTRDMNLACWCFEVSSDAPTPSRVDALSLFRPSRRTYHTLSQPSSLQQPKQTSCRRRPSTTSRFAIIARDTSHSCRLIFATMALPAVKNVTDCVDFSQTVLPYVPQLLSLPTQAFEAAREQQYDVLKELYLSTNPLVTSVAFSLLIIPIVFVVGEISRNFSQIDRLWSILPSVYNVHYAVWARLNGLAPTAVNSVTVIILMWSVCLILQASLQANLLPVAQSFCSIANSHRRPG